MGLIRRFVMTEFRTKLRDKDLPRCRRSELHFSFGTMSLEPEARIRSSVVIQRDTKVTPGIAAASPLPLSGMLLVTSVATGELPV